MRLTEEQPVAGTSARGPRWRLRFPADGSAVFELTVSFDESAARALVARIAELAAHERVGLVVDVSSAGNLDAEQQGRLLRVVDAARTRPLVVVTPCAPVFARRLRPAHRGVVVVAAREQVRQALRVAARPAPRPRPADDDIGARCRWALEHALAPAHAIPR